MLPPLISQSLTPILIHPLSSTLTPIPHTIQQTSDLALTLPQNKPGNTLTLLSGLIAAALYGNIGIKVFYNNVLVDILGAPLLTSRRGKLGYAALVPAWWTVAFLIAAAIPAYVAFVSIISASTLLNLSYTVPPWLALGYDIRRHTMAAADAAGEAFDPVTGTGGGRTSGWGRYVRGYFAGGPAQVALNVFHTLILLASLGLSGLGLWASIEG